MRRADPSSCPDHQMARPGRVDIDLRPMAGQSPGGSPVVQVDVGDEDVADVFQREALVVHRRFKGAEERLRPSLHEHGPSGVRTRNDPTVPVVWKCRSSTVTGPWETFSAISDSLGAPGIGDLDRG